MNKKRNISGSNNGAKKRPHTTDLEKSDPKNIGVYKHSTDNWKIKINEDSWTIFENQIVPKAAKEFIELPLLDLVELGILIKIDSKTDEKNPRVDEKKSKVDVEDDDFDWPLT